MVNSNTRCVIISASPELDSDFLASQINADDYVVISSLNGAGFHGGDNNIVYQIVGQPPEKLVFSFNFALHP